MALDSARLRFAVCVLALAWAARAAAEPCTLYKPQNIAIAKANIEYPNAKYPETGRLDCPRMGQSFTYYLNPEQRAHPEEDPGKYAYLWAGRPVQVSFSGELFAASPGVEVIQASANAYKECPEYRRTCALVRIPHGGNYVISSLDDSPRTYGPVHLAGRFGFAALDSAGRLPQALLLEGTELACGGQTLKARLARASFAITKVDRRTVELAQPLAAALAQPGGYVRSGQTAFAIEKVEGRSVTFRDFPFEGGKEIVALSAVRLAAERQEDRP